MITSTGERLAIDALSMRRELMAAEPTPFSRTMALVSREGSAQMALVGKAASQRYLCKVQTALQQQSLGPFYAPLYQPSMRRRAGRPSEGTGEMAGRQAAFPGEIGNRWVAVEMGFDEFIGPPKLPGCKPASNRTPAVLPFCWKTHVRQGNDRRTSAAR